MPGLRGFAGPVSSCWNGTGAAEQPAGLEASPSHPSILAQDRLAILRTWNPTGQQKQPLGREAQVTVTP